jgi:hypothetical protein
MQRSALVLLLLIVAPAPAAAEDPAVMRSGVVEIWVQPLGSIIYGGLSVSSVGGPYVSAGVTILLPQRWELVVEGTYQLVPTSYYGDGYGTATVWQFWVSLGALRFFQAGRPHDGFFVGPKLVGTYQQVGPCSGTTGPLSSDSECPYGAFPPNAGGALTITCEAGYRFQFGHFVLSLIFPSVGLGYGWNDGTFVYPDVRLSPDAPGEVEPRSGFAFSLDFNTLRLGASF